MKSGHHLRRIFDDEFRLILCVLLLSTVFNITITWNDFQLLSNARAAKELASQPGFNEIPLDLGPVVHIVTANDHYGLDIDAEWETLFPLNYENGVHVPSVGEGRKFVSVYHQLECLNTLRQLYMNPGWADDTEKENTAQHCLNVLRQAVLCNGDTTLEPSELEREPSGKIVPKATGMDLPHLCKDWVALRELVESSSARYGY